MDDVTNPYAHLIDGPMDIVIPRQVGIYVREARKRQGLTQRQLSWLCGVSERSSSHSK